MAVKRKQPDELVDRVEATREQLRSDARERLGVTGGADAPPLRDVLRLPGVSAYPLFALGMLSIVDTFLGYAFRVLAPEVSAALGVGTGAIAAVLAVKGFAEAIGPLPMAALTSRKARRALLIVVTGFLWSFVAIWTGFVTALSGLMLMLILDGLTTASVSALHPPLLLDAYPAQGRVRALSYYLAANSFGNVLAPLLVALFISVLALTWRGVFVALGVLSLAGTLTATKLRDPGFGRWDSQQIRATVREHETGTKQLAEAGLEESDVALGFFEIVQRLLLIPTIRRLLTAQVAFGVFLIPYQVFLAFFLDERWNLGPAGRGLFTAFIASVAVASLAVFARRGESLYRQDPARLVRLASWFNVIAVTFICIAALAPNFVVMVALFGIAAAWLAPLAPSLNMALLSVIPSGMRAHAAALVGIATATGGLAGAVLLGSVDAQYGITGTIISLVIPGIIGALMLRNAAGCVPPDLDRMIDETLEDEEIRQIAAGGERMPMLACRRIDFSYGQVQVLFGVDFTVDDGEMVALLGTNGAGKSTLLKVISGIGLPSGGTVRFRGADITYLDAERRLRLGITQVPGGRAVFGAMNVVENMRVFGYSIGRDRRRVEEAIERSLEAFPALADRRRQKASTLSGGEQQMLALAKALILQPRLLLIDELSLGLAPVIVGQLLDMVREINDGGTAVVLVEQSVNIALNLAEHAYFMEKGEIRFDGRSRDLLRRDDLLRAVFLEGTERS